MKIKPTTIKKRVTLWDITVKDYLAIINLQDLYKDNVNKLTKELLKYFKKEELSVKEAEQFILDIQTAFTQEARFIERFEFKGKEWGLIPNLESMPTGVYLDIDEYSKDKSKIANLLAIFYRPIIKQSIFKKWNNRYTIEKYESSSKYANLMLDLPIEIYLGLMVFFYDLNKNLIVGLNISILNEKKNIDKMTLSNS